MSNVRVILKWVCTLPKTAWLVGWECDEGSAQAMGQLWSGSQGTSFPESQSSVFGGMCVCGGWIYECCVQRHYAVLEGNGSAAGRRVVPGWGCRMSAAAGSQSPFCSCCHPAGFIWARPSTTWHHQEHHRALTSCISPTETSCTRGTPGKNSHSSSTAILFSMPPVLPSV